MGFGRRALKELAVAATRGQGIYSLEDIQRAINKWYPRGLEMFGNERSGETAVAFGFKPKTNGQAQAEYIAEVEGIIEGVNIAIVRVHHPTMSPDEARSLIREVQHSGEARRGIRPEDLLLLPDRRFFRRRGPEEYVFQPYDLRGNLLTEGGRPIAPEKYLEYLARVLPEPYLASEDFRRYAEQLKVYHARGTSEATPFWIA